MTPVYLDYNATAPLRPEARAAMVQALDEGPGNPSSVHGFGRAARRRLETAREAVAALAGVAPQAVVFTSGGTEANALACAPVPHLASAVEHASVLAHLDPARGDRTIPVDGEGRIDLAALDALLADSPGALVSVMAVNNETGVIQPIEAVAQRVRAAGGRLHVDAVQAAGRLDLAPIAALADTLSLSAHKLGGPPGVGALIVRPDDPALRPILVGGRQEGGRRAGTENTAGIVGFAAAATAALADLPHQTRLADLRDGIEAACAALVPGLPVAGAGAPRVANTSALAMPGVPAETQVMALDLDGVAVSAGAACSSGKVQASPVLAAMGWPADLAGATLRLSLGWASEAADAERFVAAWGRLYRRHRDRRAAA